GTSNTIMVAEKLSKCGTANMDVDLKPGPFAGSSALPSPPFPPSCAVDPNGALATNTWAWHQTGSASVPMYLCTYPHGALSGKGFLQPVGVQSIFQANPVTSISYDPTGVNGTTAGCDFFRASAAHTGGMNTVFADASVHFLSGGISPTIW